MGTVLTTEMSYIPNIPQAMDNDQNNTGIINQPLAQTFKRTLDPL
jgi:hypothetical protein